MSTTGNRRDHDHLGRALALLALLGLAAPAIVLRDQAAAEPIEIVAPDHGWTQTEDHPEGT
ncbi:hypothetical protein [Streptomyces clavuligerus]|uniref:hypothetical protein n=1 Tax=Streptomyces clavuligerus TaxID=1901 RepID=UPI0003015DFE|nr:hypothetical protein [Streptomyces clavuligerus]QPJ98265.1 hypothetical protein GE265_35280 [Streptomyces clavuligerus]WDN56398.1 hypothetical protein LL058_31645 [Streptomyces clavuligerus]